MFGMEVVLQIFATFICCMLHAAAAAIPTYLYEAHAVILYMPGVGVTLR